MINRGWHSSICDYLFRYLTFAGLDQFLVPLIVILIAIPALRRCGVTCLLAYAIAGIANLEVKQIALRLRPGNLLSTLVAPDEPLYTRSFPSGHTTIAFAVAVAIVLTWPGPHRRLAGGIALVVATGVGVSRIYRGVHWPTDVLGGICLGLLAACLAWLILSRPAMDEPEATPRPSEEPASDLS